MSKVPWIVTLTGPTCSGKSSLESALCSTGRFSKVISHTTRRPRPNEHQNDDYYFVSDAVFEATSMVESVTYSGCKYGVSEREIVRHTSMNRIPVVVVEPNGAQQIAAWAQRNGYYRFGVYLTAPLHMLIERYLKRTGTDIVDRSDYHALRLTSMVHAYESWPNVTAENSPFPFYLLSLRSENAGPSGLASAVIDGLLKLDPDAQNPS